MTAWLVAREQAAAEMEKAGLLFTDALAAAPDELRGEIGIDLGWRLVDKNPGLIERKLRDAVFRSRAKPGGRALRALAADKIETVMAEIETGGLSQLDLLALAEALAAKGRSKSRATRCAKSTQTTLLRSARASSKNRSGASPPAILPKIFRLSTPNLWRK